MALRHFRGVPQGRSEAKRSGEEGRVGAGRGDVSATAPPPPPSLPALRAVASQPPRTRRQGNHVQLPAPLSLLHCSLRVGRTVCVGSHTSLASPSLVPRSDPFPSPYPFFVRSADGATDYATHTHVCWCVSMHVSWGLPYKQPPPSPSVPFPFCASSTPPPRLPPRHSSTTLLLRHSDGARVREGAGAGRHAKRVSETGEGVEERQKGRGRGGGKGFPVRPGTRFGIIVEATPSPLRLQVNNRKKGEGVRGGWGEGEGRCGRQSVSVSVKGRGAEASPRRRARDAEGRGEEEAWVYIRAGGPDQPD